MGGTIKRSADRAQSPAENEAVDTEPVVNGTPNASGVQGVRAGSNGVGANGVDHRVVDHSAPENRAAEEAATEKVAAENVATEEGAMEQPVARPECIVFDAETADGARYMTVLGFLRDLPPIPLGNEGKYIRIEPSEDELHALERLLQSLPESFTTDDRDLLLTAYIVASYAHRVQVRNSGEPYVTHPIAVATILANLHMDPDTLAAGLLHDVVEDTELDIEFIRGHFDETIASLVDGVTKLRKINEIGNAQDGIADAKAESLRKMFLAMVDDVRVVIIKLADRLHNMRTLGTQKKHKQKRIARETLDIFAPLANRLGIWQIKWELEDLSFRYLEPNTYRELARAVEQKRDDREKWVANTKTELGEELAKAGIKAEISGRPKHIYSIYRKMHRKDIDFDQIYDIHGFRIIVENEGDCYAALGVVHGIWRPIPGEFDDYIANPKDNMYRSLHTAVLSRRSGRPMEIQIRTRDMHEVAERGIAAHWQYKEEKRHERRFQEKIAWLRQLMEWRQDVSDAAEFVKGMKSDVFHDRVYVFTPQGDVIDLPAGSTPIDFAYAIHTELGHRCRGANIKGRLVPLDYKLQNGDQVTVIAAKRGGPSRDLAQSEPGVYRHAARPQQDHAVGCASRTGTKTSIAAGRCWTRR